MADRRRDRDVPELVNTGKLPGDTPYIVPRGKGAVIRRLGLVPYPLGDFYHHAMTMPWSVFIAAASGLYLSLNVVFAALYLLDMKGIDQARPGSVLDAFFFSIQTMATIGYGRLVPLSTYDNIIVTIETLFSLFTVALLTGLLFARFSRPTSRVRFSSVGVVSPMNGVPTLAVRVANERRNQILEADVSMTLLQMETTKEGKSIRRFYDLALARSHTPVFSLSFQIMHPVAPDSPLADRTRDELIAEQAELLVTVTGLDETSTQRVHARWSYRFDEILYDRHFVDLFGTLPNGEFAIDYRRFDDTVPS